MYQIMPYSYADSNGDRIGDLLGIVDSLDYIQDMGYEGLWLTPICPAPTYHKYDPTDYYDIDPTFGTLDDYDILVEECHKRGMTILFDLVFNHTALKHPWFDENAPWYREEIERTADALARSGKCVEVNTGAIARGWLDEPYPSRRFRDALRARGVRFVLSSDAHSADSIDAAFDRFGDCEDFILPPWSTRAK